MSSEQLLLFLKNNVVLVQDGSFQKKTQTTRPSIYFLILLLSDKGNTHSLGFMFPFFLRCHSLCCPLIFLTGSWRPPWCKMNITGVEMTFSAMSSHLCLMYLADDPNLKILWGGWGPTDFVTHLIGETLLGRWGRSTYRGGTPKMKEMRDYSGFWVVERSKRAGNCRAMNWILTAVFFFFF